jgi:class 3 adenylate cyclase/YHS domain-containing protein
MMAFTESRDAVSSALDIEERTSLEAQFPALRGAIHFGSVLYREGGYVGSNVNVAARVASEAKRNQILVTAEVRREAAALRNVEFVPVGRRRVKGLADEIELFEVRRSAAPDRQTVVDPVCGMELGPTGIAAKVTLAGKYFSFCSESCLRIFVGSRN